MKIKMISGIVALAFSTLLFGLCSVAQAQQPNQRYRVGYLSVRNEITRHEDAFRKRMQELGYVEGKNLVIDWRFANGKNSLFQKFATELIRENVNAIVCQGIAAAAAAKKASTSIPIIMSNADVNPVEVGLVTSLARPGGNVTGFTSISSDLAGKRLELLKETVPKVSYVAILSRPRIVGGAIESHVKETEVAARASGITPRSIEVSGPEELETAFRSARKNAQALIIVTAGGILNDQSRIVDLAISTRLPVMYTNPELVLAGGLMGYAADLPALARGAAEYVDRIFKGSKPADLPVQQPTKFEFAINLRAAKQIGLTIPPNVLARADKVIR